MIDRSAVLFLAGGALFGATLLGELVSGDSGGQPDPTPARAAGEPRPAHRVQSPRVDDLVTTTLSRPLFSATRRPAERAAPDRPADPELTNIRLTGIIIEADRRTAIFAVQGAKPLVRSEGETVNDWHLDRIASHEVTLTGPAGTTTLEPKRDANLVRPPGPQPAASATRPGVPPMQPPFPAAAPLQPRPAATPAPARVPKVGPNAAQPGNPVRPRQ
jgi:general secretion pathway protein N